MKKIIKKVYDFKSDVLFKYSLADDKDYDCRYLLKLFIEGIFKYSMSGYQSFESGFKS